MTEAILLQIITTAGLIVVAVVQVAGSRRTKQIGASVEEIRADTRVTRKQTENDHTDAEFPNLRDEITAIRRGTVRGLERIERHIKDVDDDQKSTRHSLDRHLDDADRKLAEINRSILRVSETAERQHVAACPARRPWVPDLPPVTPDNHA